MGSKNAFFSKKFVSSKSFFIASQMVWDPQKTQNWPFIPPNGPHLVPFCGHFVPIWGQKTRFSRNFFFAANHFLSVPRWSGTLKNRKLPLYTPQWSPNDIYWVPRWSGTLKKPKTGLLHPPPIWAPPVATHPARSRKELSPIQTLVISVGVGV